MQRFKRIAHRGWLEKALSVATFGYYPLTVIQGKLCATITITTPGATFAMVTPGATWTMVQPFADVAMTTPSATMTMTAPGATINMEDCT